MTPIEKVRSNIDIAKRIIGYANVTLDNHDVTNEVMGLIKRALDEKEAHLQAQLEAGEKMAKFVERELQFREICEHVTSRHGGNLVFGEDCFKANRAEKCSTCSAKEALKAYQSRREM